MAANTFTDGRAVTALEVTRLGAAAAGSTYALGNVGGAVTVNAAMTLNVSAVAVNTVSIAGAFVGTAYVASTVVIGASDPTNPRRDAIYYDTSGAVGVSAGAAAAVTATTGPVLPTLTATQFLLCEVYVGAGVTSIVSGNLTDRRQIAYQPALREVWQPIAKGAVSLAAGTANVAYGTFMEPVTIPMTITKLRTIFGGSTDNIDVGLYSWDGTTATRLASIGSTAFPGAADYDADITDTVVYPGIRYIAFVGANGTTATFGRYSVQTNAPAVLGVCVSKAASFPLPATMTTLTNLSSTGPVVFGLVSGGNVA